MVGLWAVVGLWPAASLPLLAGQAAGAPAVDTGMIRPSVQEQVEVPAIGSPHPRLFLTPARIAATRQAIAERREPVHGSWRALQEAADRHISQWEARPYTGTSPRDFYFACLPDASAARDLALAYTFSGEEHYAEKALEILDAWLSARPLPASRFDPGADYPGAGMFVARSIFSFVWTYDLVYGYPGFTPALEDRARTWFSIARQVIEIGGLRWAANDYFDKQYFNNHLVAESLGLALIGSALGDRELVQFATDHPLNPRDFKSLIAGVILMPGEEPYYRDSKEFPVQAGEIFDRYRHFEMAGHFGDYVTKPNRGLQYAMLSLELLAITADLHFNSGVDFFSYTAPAGENLERSFEFYSDFYRLRDASIKGGYYAGETDRIGTGGDRLGIFEIGGFHYPENASIREVLASSERTRETTLLLGYPALIYGGGREE